MITGLFTRFMDNGNREGSKSLLDYGAIDNDHVHTVTSFTIDENARYSCGSDHALLECIIEVVIDAVSTGHTVRLSLGTPTTRSTATP